MADVVVVEDERRPQQQQQQLAPAAGAAETKEAGPGSYIPGERLQSVLSGYCDIFGYH